MGNLFSPVNYHIVVYLWLAIINLDIKNQCIDYLYARFKQVVKGELIRNSLIDRLEIEQSISIAKLYANSIKL